MLFLKNCVVINVLFMVFKYDIFLCLQIICFVSCSNLKSENMRDSVQRGSKKWKSIEILFFNCGGSASVWNGLWCFNRHQGRIFLHQGHQQWKLDSVFFAVINFYIISLGDKEIWMIVLLGTEVVFFMSLFPSFAKVSAWSFLSGSLYWRTKTMKKGEKGIFKFTVLSYANQSMSLPCIALPFIWCY